MGRLLHLHRCAAASEASDALAPFVFIKEKYSQDCWLQASLQEVPAAAAAAVAAGAASLGGHVHAWDDTRNSMEVPSAMLLASS